MLTHLSEADLARARQIWAKYQEDHDVSDKLGKAVGIDPLSGRVWFGDSAVDIRHQMDEKGDNALLYFLRVGRDYYWRKGGRR
jgi:hypothetical protein